MGRRQHVLAGIEAPLEGGAFFYSERDCEHAGIVEIPTVAAGAEKVWKIVQNNEVFLGFPVEIACSL